MEICGFKEIERERYNEHKIVVVYGVVVRGSTVQLAAHSSNNVARCKELMTSMCGGTRATGGRSVSAS